MSCPCAKKHTFQYCKQYMKKAAYRDARRKNALIDNPLEKWECDEAYAKTCPQFVPYPPRMTQEEYTAAVADLLAGIPQEFREALSAMAWVRGHSAGYEEVIGILGGLVNDLKDPIHKFANRMLALRRIEE